MVFSSFSCCIVDTNQFFRLYQQNKFSESKVKFRLVIAIKGSLKLPNLHMLVKQKNPSLARNLVFGIFGKLLIVFSAKVNLLYLLYSMAKNSNLDDSGISLPVFRSISNLKLGQKKVLMFPA